MSQQNPTNCHAPQSGDPTDQPRSAPRVLVADDEPGNLRLTELQLRRLGLDVVSCINGRQAIDLATSQQFDMIFMDMQMPLMDGFEATALMREQGLTTPIVALTAYAFSADRKRCLDAGCTDYIAKPVKPELMAKIVKKHTPLSAPATGPAPCQHQQP